MIMYFTPKIVSALLLSTLFAYGTDAWAQSPFRTAKSDGSIVLNTGGLVQASFEEALFRVGYVVNHKDRHASAIRENNPTKQVHGGVLYGFEIQGKPSDNVASLFRSDKVTAGSQATLSFGIGNIFSHQPSANQIPAIVAGGEPDTGPTGLKSLNYDWLTLQATYSRSSSTLYNPTKPYVDQFVKTPFDGYGLQLAYNMEFKTSHIPLILGIAPGFKRANNVGELDKIQVEEKQTILSPDGTIQRTSTTTRSGLKGAYEETTKMTLNTDFVFYPFLGPTPTRKASVAFDIFTRSALGDSDSFVPGVGAFVTAPGAPLKVYGGVSVYRDKNKDVAVDLVAGFAF
jgi:hypothetical protein